MAEFAAAASIIALIATGTKLAISTFDFAATVGGAGKELQDIATEVSNLCSVFKQLQVVLSHAHFQPSREALKTVERIVKQCRGALDEINATVAALRASNGEDIFPSATPELINRVKWTFKKPKILKLRSTLEACKSSLIVMLNIMLLAEQTSQSTGTEVVSSDQETNTAIIQSLVIAQQCAVEKLEHYEDEVEKEQETANLLPGVHTEQYAHISHRRKSRGRLVRMFTGLSLVTDLPTTNQSTMQMPTRSERASLWLDSILAPPDEDSEPHPGRRKKRISSAGTANAPAQLLRKWIEPGNQEDTTIRNAHAAHDPHSHSPTGVWQHSTFSFSNGTPEVLETSLANGIVRTGTDLISPKTGRVHSVGFHKVVGCDGAIEAASFAIVKQGEDDSYEAVMHSILQDNGVFNSSSDFRLCIYFGGKTRMLKSTDKPLDIMAKYEEMEMDPRLIIKHEAHLIPSCQIQDLRAG